MIPENGFEEDDILEIDDGVETEEDSAGEDDPEESVGEEEEVDELDFENDRIPSLESFSLEQDDEE